MKKVTNKNRHPNANAHYWYAKADDGRELLFTEADVQQARERALINHEDLEDFEQEPSQPSAEEIDDTFCMLATGAGVAFLGFMVGFATCFLLYLGQ